MSKKTKTIDPNKRRSQWGDTWRRLRRNKVAMVGLALVILLVLSAIFADVIAPYDISKMSADRFAPPSAKYLFGTDNYGRDIFSRVIYGGRISLLVAFLSCAFSLIVGAFFGLTAGYFGGVYETVIMRLTDVLMSIPQFLMAILVSVALGGGILNTSIAIAISTLPSFIRLTRASALTVRGEQYIESASAYGSRSLRIMFKQILPNIVSPILVETAMRIAGGIMAISGLSFIGLGVQPPIAEWGSMMSSSITYFRDYPGLVVFPGIAIIIAVFGFNLFGDGLRDALDPKLKD